MKVKQKILSFCECATIMSHHYGHVSKSKRGREGGKMGKIDLENE